MERVFATHLAHVASHLMGKVSGIDLPQPILKQVISLYSLATGAALEEMAEPAGGFRNFGEFFGRRLRDGARTVSADPVVLISPCDGKLIRIGTIESNGRPSFLVKGSRYSLNALFGTDTAETAYGGGGYLVIYLHPRDYHRVHTPARAELTALRHVPGARYPVNSLFENRVDEIYGKNERLVFRFALPNGGEMALIMVAAFGVGNMATPYDALLANSSNHCRAHRFDSPRRVSPGDELGAFLVGSTVVLVWSQGAFDMDGEVTPGPIKMGRKLGTLVV